MRESDRGVSSTRRDAAADSRIVPKQESVATLLRNRIIGGHYTRVLRASKPSSITFSVDGKGLLRGAALMNAGKFRRVVTELINSRVPVDVAALSDAAVAIPSLALRTEVPMEQAGVA